MIASAGKRMMGKTPFLNLECINTKIGLRLDIFPDGEDRGTLGEVLRF